MVSGYSVIKKSSLIIILWDQRTFCLEYIQYIADIITSRALYQPSVVTACLSNQCLFDIKVESLSREIMMRASRRHYYLTSSRLNTFHDG